jgi:hypothetical protein
MGSTTTRSDQQQQNTLGDGVMKVKPSSLAIF